MAPQSSAYRMAAAIWGAMGLVALLGYAIVRLASVVADGMGHHWGWQHIAVAAGNTVFMAWSEGYRGFQLRFSPRSAARVKWLAQHANAMQTLLAPLFVMGYFGTTRRRMIGVYLLTGFILAAIAVIHGLAQPWRAALDIGVVVGPCLGPRDFPCGAAAHAEYGRFRGISRSCRRQCNNRSPRQLGDDVVYRHAVRLGHVVALQAVPQHRPRQRPDVVGDHVIAPGQERPRPGTKA